jgi:uncharacterized membrane protein
VVDGAFVYWEFSAALPVVTILSVILYLYLTIRLSMVPYLLADNPELSVIEALSASFRLTRGRVFELFVMQLSFLPWVWFVAITLLFGLIYLSPYVQATYAAYYMEFSGANRSVEDEPARAD